MNSQAQKKLSQVDLSVMSLTTNLGEAKDSDIVFYRIKNESAKSVFLERLAISKSKIVITNRSFEDPKVFSASSDEEFEFLLIETAEKKYPIRKEIKFAGVTGTNGKTSTTSFISQILEQNSKSHLLLGTTGAYVNGELLSDFGLTSPSYIELLKMVYSIQEKIDYVIMEVSSHALDQGRLGNIKLDAAAWTNLSQDHLDYHGSMENYFEAKRKIIDIARRVFVSKREEELISMLDQRVVTFVNKRSEIAEVAPFLKLAFNQENVELAIAVIECLDKSLKVDLEKLAPPPGRLEQIEFSKDKLAFVDYAHTPDALEKVTKGLKESFKSSKLITVFGCGGDRDRLKRPLMAQAATKYSDEIIVTNDNPRTEDENQIFEDILKGIDFKPQVIADRKLAIETAIESMEKGDILLVAGKGHEDYQIIGTQKRPFSDREVILKTREGS